MLIGQRFILLFLVCYSIRAIANDGNSFQWKINVAIRTLPHWLSSALLCLPLFLPSALLCLPSALLLFFHSSLLQTFCSAPLFRSFQYFRLCSALCSDPLGGAYPFLEKPKYHFLPPKIPPIFSKTSPCPYI